MEFLLINHPLDCPICDQGGECQLQDLAVGYGSTASRYKEEKRVVFNKNLGALISTDMTRCIHCTRCVRFGQEIAGVMELGVGNRGEHSEIMAFVNRTVDSELSGNMIDLCPVGALTSKPFRFSARTWELSRRKSVSPHDSLGSNLIVQVKHEEVKRVLPLDNEAINECWISDKDRFSYEALRAADRLTKPRIKQGGVWHDTDWQTALEYAANSIQGVVAEHGSNALGALLSPHSTLEELYLAQKLVRALGSDNLDSRLRQSDFSLDGHQVGASWLGMPIAEIDQLDAALVVGSFLRKDHPLLAQRLRKAERHYCKVMRLHVAADDWLIPLDQDVIVAPDLLVGQLAKIVKSAVSLSGGAASSEVSAALACVEVDAASEAIAQALLDGDKATVLLGNYAVQHSNYASLHVLAQALAKLTGASFGVIGESANSVGADLLKVHPINGGANTKTLLSSPCKAYLLMGLEPQLDTFDGVAAQSALSAADSVVYLGSFASEAIEAVADVMLPIAPFAETSGSFVNTQGLLQSFHAVTPPLGETRPGWKVLRVLANLLALEGFTAESSEAVRNEAIESIGDLAVAISNEVCGFDAKLDAPISGLQRVSDVPIHFADALARRAPALQATRDAATPAARVSAATLASLGAAEGDMLRVRSAAGEVLLPASIDSGVPDNCVRIAAAHVVSVVLGAMTAELTLERA